MTAMPMAHGARGPAEESLRPSSPSEEAKTASTRRNVHRTSPPKALTGYDRGWGKAVEGLSE